MDHFTQKRPTGSDREDLFGSGPHLCRRSDRSDVSSNGQRYTAASKTRYPDAGECSRLRKKWYCLDIAKEEWPAQSEMVRLNCEALTNMTLLCAPYLSQGSRILQIASAAAFAPQPQFAVYAATKSYVLSFSRALGAEWKKKGIYVTAVCPGPVDTEFFERCGQPENPLKKMTMAKAPNVVKQALLDARRKKAVSIFGFWMRALYILVRIVPVSWILNVQTIGKK